MSSVFGDTDTPPAIGRIDEQFAIDIANTTGLNITIVGGNTLFAGAVTFVASAALVLNDNATNYICISPAVPEIVNDGATVGAGHSVLYEIITLAGAIVSCTDSRAIYFPAIAESATAASMAAVINAATAKATPIDADKIGFFDSAAGLFKYLTFANLWTWIQAKLAAPGAIGGTTPAAIAGTTITGTAITGTSFTRAAAAGIGVSSISTNNNALYGESFSQVAIYGVSNQNNGVYGISSLAFGVYGYSSSSHGVYGVGQVGRGVVAESTGTASSALRVIPQSAQPTTGLIGDIYVTAAGVLKICTVAGTPGTWVSVGAQV